MYRSSTTLRVATVGSGLIDSRTDINYTDRLMNTYSRIVTGASVSQQIRNQLGLENRPSISVELIPNTELLRITAEASDPEAAQQVAELAATFLIEKSRELYAGEGQATIDILGRQLQQLEAELADLRGEYETLLASPATDQAAVDAASQNIALKERTYTTLLDEYERLRLEDAMRMNAVSVVEPAHFPGSPATPRTQMNLVLGALVGLFIGIGLALIFENLDTRLRTPTQIETVTGAPVIGNIPSGGRSLGTVGINGANVDLPHIEAFRRIRINLMAIIPDGQPYAMLVTSAKEGEGKSTVSANLAVSIAKSGRSVVLLDCDLHEPTIDDRFGLPNDRGLTSYLTQQASLSGVLQSTELSTLKVVTTGPTLINSSEPEYSISLAPAALAERLYQGTEILGSAQMRIMLRELKTQFDVVILDTPALETVTDAAVLVPAVDDVLLVVAQDQADLDTVRSVRDQLAKLNAKSLHIIVNRSA
jgi:Mrp family chromosome partitioning ATPase